MRPWASRVFPPRQVPSAIEGFVILERLGAGAAGEVFLARSPGGQLVAIKTIAHPDEDPPPAEDAAPADDVAPPSSGRASTAFFREASVCARLSHPCIVQVRALLGKEGVPAIVFEYVPGVALARVLRLSDARRIRLPDRAAWQVVERVLAALAYAHGFHDERGEPTPIVHRDVSPANVLLDWKGGVKIADFGIAKVMGVSPATRFGLVKGTLGCMAPEQARGESVDERADVYAAALLAWRLSTGRLPFGRQAKDEFELLRAMRNPRIKPLDVIRPDLPQPVLAAIARALEPERDRRTITAAELAETLRAHVATREGEAELGALLQAWKPALERAVKRVADADSDSGRLRLEHTLRYEEVALAFDDELSPDAPTYEGHALPSEPWPLPVAEEAPAGDGDVTSPLPPAPPAPVRTTPPPFDRAVQAGHATRSGHGGRGGAAVWGPVLGAVAFIAAGILASLLATWAH